MPYIHIIYIHICTTVPQALQRAHALGNSRALDSFVGEILNLHRGQGRDILWRDSNRCPAEKEYESMVLDSECATRTDLVLDSVFFFRLSFISGVGYTRMFFRISFRSVRLRF